MNVIFNKCEWPNMRPFMLGSSQARLVKNVMETKEIDVYVSLHTKTTLYINVQKNEDSFSVGFIPKGCEDLKYHTKSVTNFFECRTQEHNYLKLTKTQGMAALKRYIISLLEGLLTGLDEVKVNLFIKDEVSQKIAA